MSCIKRTKKRKRRERKEVERIYALNRDSFLKNKFAVLSGFVEGQDLPGI